MINKEINIELVQIHSVAGPHPFSSDDRVADVMKDVLADKRQNVESARGRLVDRSILIGGDLFTMGYVGFQGLQTFIPSVASAAGVGLVCGVVGGAINIGVGFVCLANGLKNLGTDNKLAFRLILDFVCLSAIGAIMIIATLAAKVTMFALVGALVTAHPWLLPVLFLVITIPTVIELGMRIKNIKNAKDFGSKLDIKTLETLVQNENWDRISEKYELEDVFNFKGLETQPNLRKVLSDKIEYLQEDVGTEAAVEIFDLLMKIQKKDRNGALEQFQVVEKEIDNWNKALMVRMFQQILYILSFAVSMVALSPTVNGTIVTGAQNLFLSFANLIPLGMDSFWPFRGNTPMAAERVV